MVDCKRGLMPIFIPDYSPGYFDQSLYPYYRAQSFKEDFWALQYLYLLALRSKPIDDYLVTAAVPPGLPTFTIMTDILGNSTDEKASNKYYKEQKLAMMAHIAGGKLTQEARFCTEWNCTLGFPVDKPQWTAREIVGFGI